MKKENKLVKKLEHLLKKLNSREYLHHFGPKKYKLKDHLLALLLKEVCQMSLRRLEKFLNLVGIKTPTYSAISKSRKRIPKSLWDKLLRETAGLSSGKVAFDGSGFSQSNASFHYMKRVGLKVPTRKYNKLSIALDVKTSKIMALKARVKPRHDIMDVRKLLKNCNIEILYADSAYDAEWIYEICYWDGIQTMIKPKKNAKKGFFRKKQQEKYDEEEYHKRSLVESGFGSLKRKYGGAIKARKQHGIKSELYLKAIAHNLELAS